MKKALLYFVLFLVPIVVSCTPKVEYGFLEKQKLLMGTLFRLKVFAAINVENKEKFDKASKEAFAEIARLEAQMSEWKPDSPISQVNQLAGVKSVKVPQETLEVLKVAEQISNFSNGAFDISFKPLGRLWNVKKRKQPPTETEIQKVLKLVGHKSIELNKEKSEVFLKKKGMSIGLGGIAKGYAAKKAGKILEKNDFKNYIVDAGGDLYLAGTKNGAPWVTGVKDPNKGGKLIKKIAIKKNSAVVTSGIYERFFEYEGKKYHHIIDVRTGYPAKGAKSVTVVSEDPTYADAMATTFLIVGPKAASEIVKTKKDLAFFMIDSNDQIHESENFSDFVRVTP
jgi:thiamine biosynthesis lipoprotein